MIKHFIKRIYILSKYPDSKVMGDVTKETILEGNNLIWDHSKFSGYMGYGTYMGRYCDINASIGRFCSIGENVSTIFNTHPTREFASTHPSFFSLAKQNGETFVKAQKFDEQIYADKERKLSVLIGNDVWIGSNATIMGGVVIGDGAIVGANAVVTKNVNPYEIVAGNPAKVIRKRFDEETINYLLEKKWWERPIEWIKENADSFESIELLKKVL